MFFCLVSRKFSWFKWFTVWKSVIFIDVYSFQSWEQTFTLSSATNSAPYYIVQNYRPWALYSNSKEVNWGSKYLAAQKEKQHLTRSNIYVYIYTYRYICMCVVYVCGYLHICVFVHMYALLDNKCIGKDKVQK